MMECSCEILVGGGSPKSTHKNTPDRLDKSRSALAEAGLIKKVKLLCRSFMAQANSRLFILADRDGGGKGGRKGGKEGGQERGSGVLAAAWLGFK